MLWDTEGETLNILLAAKGPPRRRRAAAMLRFARHTKKLKIGGSRKKVAESFRTSGELQRSQRHSSHCAPIILCRQREDKSSIRKH